MYAIKIPILYCDDNSGHDATYHHVKIWSVAAVAGFRGVRAREVFSVTATAAAQDKKSKQNGASAR